MDLASLFSSVVQSAYGVESKIADLENRTEQKVEDRKLLDFIGSIT
jgi:hypothetical protein